MPIQIVRQDIVGMAADVIVNPTDEAYSGSGGVDLQIHRAAGTKMDAECAALPPLETGDVRATKGYGLPCRYVIHTVGPIWNGGENNEARLLQNCYVNALLLARKLGAQTVAFPLISSGTFGFPKDLVMRLATQAISDFLYADDCDLEVFVCVTDRYCYEPGINAAQKRDLDDAFRKNTDVLARSAQTERFGRVSGMPPKRKITFGARPDKLRKDGEAAPAFREETASPGDLETWLKNHDDSFAVTLLKLIDKKGMTDVACYKKANVSRKTFSKINTDKEYRPSKQTVIAFAIALKLDLAETERLLRTVGFSLSHSSTFDLIIEFCIQQKIYDVMKINEILYQYDQVCLGC